MTNDERAVRMTEVCTEAAWFCLIHPYVLDVATIALAVVTGGLFWSTRHMAGKTAVLAESTRDMAGKTADLAASSREMSEKTALLAQWTREMAEKTAVLAENTIEANRLADRHHQEGLMPLVTLKATLLRDFSENEEPLTHKPAWKFTLKGVCVNTGPGPALNVSLGIIASGYQEQPPMSLGSIAAGGEVSVGSGLNLEQGPVREWWVVSSNENEDRTSRYWPYTARLYFDSLFTRAPDMRGLTVQQTHSGEADDLRFVEQRLPGICERRADDQSR